IARSVRNRNVSTRRFFRSASGPAVSIDGRGFNVLLISVDTTRADHLGCYGHPIVKTPNIDRFAAEGTRFAQCISAAPLTLPSHSTMLTGSDPYVHGARDNGIYVLHEKNTTLPEIFKQAGYATHGEVAAEVLNRIYQLDQGFDTFDDPGSVRLSFLENWREQADRTRLGLGSEPPPTRADKPEVYLERSAEEVAEAALKRLKEKAQKSEKFFMFLHFFDPHWPHHPPERFTKQYTDGYYAEIAYFDEQFGRVIQSLRDLDLASSTLVILTSDHGESRGQHGEQTHANFVYDATLHVPLILWCPGQVPAGQVVESQVRLLDIAPTIVEFAGLERTPQMQGTSLLPLLEDPSGDLHLMCYSESEVVHNIFGFSVLRSFRGEGWKYIHAPVPELYNLAEDPLEVFSLAPEQPERVARMRQQLRDRIAQAPPPPGGRAARNVMDEEAVRKLQALGYLSGLADPSRDDLAGTELDHFEPTGDNPIDHVAAITYCNQASGSIRIGKCEEAEKRLEQVIALLPACYYGYSLMGEAMAGLERYDEAVKYFKRSVELNPDYARDHRFLGGLHARANQWEEAEASYRTAVKLEPANLYTYVRLAKLLAFQRRYDEALAEYDKVIELAPEVSDFRLFQGVSFRLAGKLDESLSAIRKALELEPSNVQAHVQLSATLRRMGRVDEAIQDLTRVVSEMPDAASLYYALAECYTEKNELKAAQVQCEKVTELVPENPVAWQNLGVNLVMQDRHKEGIVFLRKAVELNADYGLALDYLAAALEQTGQVAEAVRVNDRLLASMPLFATAYPRGARLASSQGDWPGALALLRRGCETLPKNPMIANELAWRLATCAQASLRNGSEAVEVAEQANDLTRSGSVDVLDTLAAACAEAGRFEDAAVHAQRAIELAREAGSTEKAERIAKRLALYRQRKPYHESE
ncbi:MAG: sulfatase-like hydrolase/transferase, partial [Phycisphaerae bacterium]